MVFGSFGVAAQLNSLQQIKFSLSCKVTDQIIFEVNEGVTKRYSQYTDGFNNGSNFNIDFSFIYSENVYVLEVRTPEDYHAGTRLIFNKFNSQAAVNNGNSFSFVENTYSGNISRNYMILNEIFGKIKLERYYKNDWQLIATSGVMTGGTHMMTANCLNMPLQFDKILENMEKISGELED